MASLVEQRPYNYLQVREETSEDDPGHHLCRNREVSAWKSFGIQILLNLLNIVLITPDLGVIFIILITFIYILK